MIGLLVALSIAAPDIRGRVEGYRGLYPLHVAALKSRDLADPVNPLGWATTDPDTGKFEIALPDGADEVYLLAQLDLERMGPRLNGGQLFFLKKLPVRPDDLVGKRLLFDLGDMELAHVMRDQKGAGGAPWIALGLAVLLYGIGILWRRRLQAGPRAPPVAIPSGGPPLALIALGSTVALLPNLGREALELLEFTYFHEGLRPESVLSLLTDPISAELSHPPLWPLLLRALSTFTQAEWWLRTPAVLAHLGYVLVVYRLVAGPGGRTAGLLAAAFAALLPVGFYYGRDATPYSLLALVSAVAALAAVEDRPRLFAGALVLGFFTHYTVAVLGVTLGLALFHTWVRDRDDARFRRILGAYGLVIALPLVWSVHFIRTFLASGMSTRLMSVDYLPDPGFVEYVSHFGAVVLGLPPELRYGLPVALVAAVWGARVAIQRWPRLGRIAAWQLLMLVVYVLFVHAMYMRFAGGRVFYAYRWSTVFVPAVAVCYAAATLQLWERARVAGVVLAGLILTGAAFQDARIVLEPQRPDQWAAAQQIRDEQRAEDAFCALPAVYYGQLFNYALFDRAPADLMGWPRWEGGLYGPLHPRNTTIETLSNNLAFRRVWVAVYDERMFGTRKFDPATSDHQLQWMRAHLVEDGRWEYPHLTLYRFVVPGAPERLWKDGVAEIDFSRQITNYRYFPKLLHTQRTGLSMSAADVALRIPVPPERRGPLAFELKVYAGRALSADDLTLTPPAPLTFEPQPEGGTWRGTLEATGDRLEIELHRSAALAADHRNTTVRLGF